MSQNALAAGLTDLGLNLPEDAPHQLLAFRDLLLKWNKTYNLTALRDLQVWQKLAWVDPDIAAADARVRRLLDK